MRSTPVSPSERARRVAARSSGSSRRLRIPGSGVKRLICSDAARAVGLEVGPAGEAVADEQRQHVVAVRALGLLLVDLDQVVEAERTAEKRPVPHQVVERAEEHGAAGAPSSSAPAGTIDGRAAVVHLDPLDEPVGDERIDVRADHLHAAREPAMLDDPGLGQRAASLHGPKRVTAAELFLGRSRCLESLARDHAFRQVVDALESLPARNRDLACGEEVLERALRGLPVPHRLAAPLERADRKRTFVAESRQYLTLDGPAFLCPLPSPPVVIGELDHPALEERVVLDREQAGLVRPVLEDASATEEPRDEALVETADPGRERDPVGAVDGRDRVELNHAEARDLRRDLAGRRPPLPRGVALVRDDVPPERGERNRPHARER